MPTVQSLCPPTQLPRAEKYEWPAQSRSQWREILPESDESLKQLKHVAGLARPLVFHPGTLPATLQIVPHKSFLEHILPGLQDTNGEIVVLPEYPAVVKRIAEIYQKKPDKGVLIMGQPGVGKSVFLTYLLLVLLSLTHEEDPYTGLRAAPTFDHTIGDGMVLFFDCKVYKPRSAFDIKSLPGQKKNISNWFKPPVWVLVDLEGFTEEPRGL
ncbi:hypothetical protein BDP27DRAFT_1339257 [Rhodocollybia butyracea]|uniref:Uncharacterized protein n=1 Tax=Rhodocollybia butyracea TaxID=206335 RepID=A0A9P5PCI0_9AGAR|nr:hypothetical protein BDP27DRAFT_1339257 [Rhodocollybia butyracea]